jgi:hypothetical protein
MVCYYIISVKNQICKNLSLSVPLNVMFRLLYNHVNAYIIYVNEKLIMFRSTLVQFYHRNETIIKFKPIDVINDSDNFHDNKCDPKTNESNFSRIRSGCSTRTKTNVAPAIILKTCESRKKGRSKGSKNKFKIAMITGIYIIQKKRKNTELAVKLRAEGKITLLGKSFELSNQAEIKALISRGLFRFEKFEPAKYDGI